MSQELKPCAHCGGEAYIHHPFSTLDRKGLFPSCFVKCKSCMLSTHYSQSEAEAIAAWNRRAQPERKLTDDVRKFLEDCADTSGGMVSGNTLSVLANRVLRAQPASDVPETNCGNMAAQPAASWSLDLSKCQMAPLQSAVAPAIVAQPAAATGPDAVRVIQELIDSHKRDVGGQCDEDCDIVAGMEAARDAVIAMNDSQAQDDGEKQFCNHTVTQGRDGEKGSWCCACGIKVFDVDERECGGCAHHRKLINGDVCRKHLMAITANMHVTYKIAEGTCWTAKP